jgi:hypothetical protein
VRITHAAHPLKGVVCPVISPAGRWQDPTQILVELPEGERRFIPVSWTDLSIQVAFPEGMRFPLEQLIALNQLLEEIQAGHNLGTMAAKTGIEPLGGSHATADSGHLGSIDPLTAYPDPPHPGTDASSPSDAGGGGAG